VAVEPEAHAPSIVLEHRYVKRRAAMVGRASSLDSVSFVH
jgi:hypothetical protein